MSLRYAALLAPACAFTHPQQPRRIVVRRDYSSIDDVFDSVFGDPWSPFGLSRLSRRRSPLAQQFGQLKRLSQAFEEQLQRVDEDDFLADTPLGQRRQLETPKEDAPTKTDESTSSLYEAPATKDGAAPEEAVAPAAPRGYAYSWSSSSVTQNGETRTTVRKNFKDADGAAKSFQERSLARDGKKLTETRTQGFGDAEAKLSFEGVDDAKSFESAWANPRRLQTRRSAATRRTWRYNRRSGHKSGGRLHNTPRRPRGTASSR